MNKSIGRTILWAVISFVIFAVIGIILYGVVFSNVKTEGTNGLLRPFKNIWRNAWAVFYYVSLVISLVYTVILMLILNMYGGGSSINWLINIFVLAAIGATIGMTFMVLAPEKSNTLEFIAAIANSLQGVGVFFITTLFVPGTWTKYNPLGQL